jgi:hypothetical protein
VSVSTSCIKWASEMCASMPAAGSRSQTQGHSSRACVGTCHTLVHSMQWLASTRSCTGRGTALQRTAHLPAVAVDHGTVGPLTQHGAELLQGQPVLLGAPAAGPAGAHHMARGEALAAAARSRRACEQVAAAAGGDVGCWRCCLHMYYCCLRMCYCCSASCCLHMCCCWY